MQQTSDAPASKIATPLHALLGHRYRHYVLAVLFLGYVFNAIDRAILGVLLEPIRIEFNASDTQLGLLGGIAFALFYATMGIFLAALADRSNRRNVLAVCIALWSIMTALCGAAVNFTMLLLARIGTAIGEAGGSPPSHSLISDYYVLKERATALSIYALGIPIGQMIGVFCAGWLNEFYGWRMTFIIIGLPGVLVALLVRSTVAEPARGQSDQASSARANAPAPPIAQVLRYLWDLKSFRHLCLAAGLHSFVWYSGSVFNAVFFIRTHGMSTGEAGTWLSLFALVGTTGTFCGGFIADKLSVRLDERRWYLWVPGIATLVMVPFQFSSYLSLDLWYTIPSFCVMVVLASIFFGPSFAMTQALAPLRMRSVATSLLLFIQTLIGLGLGPLFVGIISDHLAPSLGERAIAWSLVIVGLVNIWAACHYFWGARTLRQDLDATAALSKSG